MAVKYWYKASNGSGNWSTVADWYLGPGGTGGAAGLPTTADDVILDAASGTGTLTIAASSVCKSFNSSAFTGTLAGASALTITTSGGTVLSLGGTHTHNGAISLTGTGGGSISFNGRSHSGIFTVAVGVGTITCTDTLTTTGTFNFTSGTLTGTNLSVGTFATVGTAIRSFSFTNLYLTSVGSVFSVITGNQTNLTWSLTNLYMTNSSAGSTRNITTNGIVGATNVYIAGTNTGTFNYTNTAGGSYTPNVYVSNSGGSIITFGASTFNNVEFVTGTTAILNSSSSITVNGNLTFCSSMTVTATSNITMAGTGNLTSFGKIITGLFVTTGTVTFIDDFVSTSSLTLTSGTLTVNGNITCTLFSSSNTAVRTLNMGNGLWTITAFTNAWSITTSTNMTLNAQGSTIKFTDNSANVLTFNGGGLTYNDVWFDRVIGGGTIALTGIGNTFNVFKISPSAVAYSISVAQTHNQNFAEFIVSGSPGALITVFRTGGGNSTFTKTTPGIVSCNYILFATQAVSASPDNTWYAGPYSVVSGALPTFWKLTTPTQRQLSSLGAG